MCNDYDAQIDTKLPELVTCLQGVTATFKILHYKKRVSHTHVDVHFQPCERKVGAGGWWWYIYGGGGGHNSVHVSYLTIVFVATFDLCTP